MERGNLDLKIVLIRLIYTSIFVIFSSFVLFLLIWYGKRKKFKEKKEQDYKEGN